MESGGFSVEASASFAYQKMEERCPGDPCKAKEVKEQKPKAHDPKDYSVKEGESVMIERSGLERWQANDSAVVGRLERGDGAQAPPEFELVTRPKVRTVHREFGATPYNPLQPLTTPHNPSRGAHRAPRVRSVGRAAAQGHLGPGRVGARARASRAARGRRGGGRP